MYKTCVLVSASQTISSFGYTFKMDRLSVLKIMHNETRLTDVLSLILMQITLHLNKDIQSTFEDSKVKDSLWRAIVYELICRTIMR